MLRQKLTCDADASLLGYNWLKGHYSPHPNFNVQHQCRDFEAVLEYAREHEFDPDGSLVQGFLKRPSDEPWAEFEELPFDPEADS